jgi:hypothetical protein
MTTMGCFRFIGKKAEATHRRHVNRLRAKTKKR